MEIQEIINRLPYSDPFLFVNSLDKVTEEEVIGNYTFAKDSFFYKGHFKGFPVTPGVILTECCAQIGLVCLGIYLMRNERSENLQIGLSSNEMEFLKPVYPDEKVIVYAEKVYFRFQKLKCKVRMLNTKGDLVCKGTISGMFKSTSHEQ